MADDDADKKMSDEMKSAITKVALVGLTSLATLLHANSDANLTAQLPAIATDLVDLGFLAYAFWSHRGMKKVPVGSIVIPSTAPAAAISKGDRNF